MKFRDLDAQYTALKPEIDAAIQSVLDRSAFILGKPVHELEEKLAACTGRKHCVCVANGTEALQLGLMSMNVGPGDAVFTSDFTYISSASSASILGATPVFVDIDLDTFNLSPAALEAAIQRVLAEGRLTPKVIVPVDLFGLPADYGAILPIAEKYGLRVLEDAAQGFGGSVGGKMAGSFGDLSATSFFPAKPLGCYGDGGAVFTDSADTERRLRSLAALGKSPESKYDNWEIGLNSRLDTIQAAILLVKLKAFFEYELDAVNQAAETYTAAFQGRIITPAVPEGYRSCWAQYSLLFRGREERDRVRKALWDRDIPAMVYYPRGLHQQVAYQWMGLGDDRFPNTMEAVNRILSLPLHPYLGREDQQRIIDAVLEAL